MTIKLIRTAISVEPHNGRGDYIYGSGATEFLRPDWTLTEARKAATGREPAFGLSLGALSKFDRYGWGALAKMLPADADSVAEMAKGCQYDDFVTGHKAYALVPIYALVSHPDAYVDGDTFTSDRLWNIVDDHQEVDEYFGYHKEHGSYLQELTLSRIEQVVLGSGYTRDTLPSDGSVSVAWQFAPLSNGDVVFLAGLEWFNK